MNNNTNIEVKVLTAVVQEERITDIPQVNYCCKTSPTLVVASYATPEPIGEFTSQEDLMNLLKSYYKTNGGESLHATEHNDNSRKNTAVEALCYTFRFPCNHLGQATEPGVMRHQGYIIKRYKSVLISIRSNGYTVGHVKITEADIPIG